MTDPWANLRGVPVPIYERCGANTQHGAPCRQERDLCGLHPRVRRFPYKRDLWAVRRGRPDGRMERARRADRELWDGFAEEREMTRRFGPQYVPPDRVGLREYEQHREVRREHKRALAQRRRDRVREAHEHSYPSVNPGPARERASGTAVAAREPTRSPERQPPAQEEAELPDDGPLPDDGSPEVTAIARWLGLPRPPGGGYRSERLRRAQRRRPAERDTGDPDDDPDGDGEPLPEAV